MELVFQMPTFALPKAVLSVSALSYYKRGDPVEGINEEFGRHPILHQAVKCVA